MPDLKSKHGETDHGGGEVHRLSDRLVLHEREHEATVGAEEEDDTHDGHECAVHLLLSGKCVRSLLGPAHVAHHPHLTRNRPGGGAGNAGNACSRTQTDRGSLAEGGARSHLHLLRGVLAARDSNP